MENTTKIVFSAVTHIGASCTVNDDRIYANGKFLNHSAADYIQISLEVSDSKCLFALADGMEDDDSGISLMNDLRKFHQKVKNSSKGINIKLDELVQCVEQSSNLIHSISLGDNDFRERKTAFAGLLIDEGHIAAVNLGNCRIYKLAGDTFKLLVNDFKRAERLLKMGIISNEQAELLSGQQKAAIEEGRDTVKKSEAGTLQEGVTYLICSSGLTDAVSEDAIYDMLSSNSDADEAASLLVEEAVKNEAEDNITAIVVKIMSSEDMPAQAPGPRTAQFRAARARQVPARLAGTRQSQNRIDAGKLVSMAILVVLIVAVLLGGFKLWLKLSGREAYQTAAPQSTQETTGTAGTAVPGDNAAAGQTGSEGDSSAKGGAGKDAAGTNTASGGNTGSGINSNSGKASDSANASNSGKASGSGTDSANGASDLVGPEGATHVVKAGDMLMKLAKKYYGDESKYKLIMEANGITDPNKITVGQELKIPPLK